jgi:RNA polymerase sigma factor (sigma-70 family)
MNIGLLRETMPVTEPNHGNGLSDTALIAAVRAGDATAYGVLYERHLGAAKRAATYLVNTAAEREDLVAEAFTRVLQVLRSGRGPIHDFRPYLLVTMRHAAINAARRNPSTALYAELPDAYQPPATEDPISARLTGNEAASAFAGLPERWRMVLWHTEVEGASPAAIAPQLGMTPNGVAALAYRAREGLKQAYLRMHLPAVERQECQAATDKLAGFVRHSISAPQRRKLSAHLANCARCRELAAGLSEVNGELRSAEPIMSWLSIVKGMFAATTVKIGTAAVIAAVTAVSVVASEPPAGRDSAAPPPAGSVAEPPKRSQTVAELDVQPASSATQDPGATPPPITTSQQGEPAIVTPSEPDADDPPMSSKMKEKAKETGNAATSPPTETDDPNKEKKPKKPKKPKDEETGSPEEG